LWLQWLDYALYLRGKAKSIEDEHRQGRGGENVEGAAEAGRVRGLDLEGKEGETQGSRPCDFLRG